MRGASILNQIKTIINSKYFLYIFAVTVFILAITVKFELVEPLLILFVIYTSLNYSKRTVIISVIYSIIILGIQDIFNLHLDIIKYLIEVVMLVIIAAYIIKSRADISKTNYKLRERVKELNGLINITKILETPQISFDQSLNKIVNLIRSSWQYPKDTCARIKYKNKEYITDNFKESKWKMETDIIIDGKEKGKIEVFYLKEDEEIYNGGPFLKEEYRLIEAISNRLSDLIKRHDQEKKIRENKKFLEITLNSIGDAVIVTDNKGSVVRMNYVAEQLTGWEISDAKEKDITEIFKIVNSKTNKKVKNPIKRVLEKGKVVGFANHTKLISKDSKEYQIADSAAPIRDQNNNIHGAVIVFRNYSEKYELNNEIKRREKLFTNAIKEAPHPIMIHAEDGEVFRINDQWTELSGYDFDDIKHIDQWFERAYPKNRNMVKEFVDNLFTLNKKVHDGEFEIITKDGDQRLWDFSSVPLGRTDDNRKLIMSMAVDITERKEMIKSIKRLNRQYSILSDINQTIVRTKEKKSLLDQVCRIIKNKGDYKSIWVGEISKVKDNLHIISASGQSSDLIEGLDIDFNDQENVESIRNLLDALNLEENIFDKFINNKEVNYRNIIYDKKGSSIAIFPIMVFSKIWGIMVVCIDQENFFDQEEFKLFKELTDDLSYAVQALINQKLRKKSEERLKESERKFRELFEKAPIGIFETNSDGRVLMINPEMAKILGYNDINQAIENYNDLGKNLYLEKDRRQEFIEKIKENGFVNGFIYRAYDKNENIRWLRMDARISGFNEDGSFTIDGFTEDITEQYQIQKELEKSEEKYRTLFENQYSVMLIIDPRTGKIIDANPAASSYYGWSRNKLKSMNIADINIMPTEQVKRQLTIANDKKSHKFQFKHKLSDGQIKDVEVFASPINLRDASYLFSIIHDITDRKKAESKIIKLSFHDKLTGLYNRAYMEEEMSRVDTKRQLPISIIMGDLNNLKLVNDTYSHQVGDDLLIRAAKIIESSCRTEDIIARWGGDEFVVLLPETPLEDAEKICTRITDCARKQDKNLLVSIALGSASKENPTEDIFKVLNRAEARMYKNKIVNRKSARSNVLSAFLNTLREKSFETENHARRMEKLCLKMGKKVGLSGSDLDRLSLLTSLHDIGKITIPEQILNKKAKLNQEEWMIIKGHTEAGYRIVSTMNEFADIAEYILYHHERWDGQGYPEGLSGEDIPLLSRILSLVDAYDVMISGRPYKKAMDVKEVKEEIKRCSGSQFDPELTKIFLNMI